MKKSDDYFSYMYFDFIPDYVNKRGKISIQATKIYTKVCYITIMQFTDRMNMHCDTKHPFIYTQLR